VAARLGASILSVDSMQVYRGMDIGTAKPSRRERAEIEHHMVDVVDPDREYTVADFQRDARSALHGAGSPVLIVGGSGLHFRSVVDPLEFPPSDAEVRAAVEATPPHDLLAELLAADPQVGAVLDLHNPRRVVRAVEILRITGRTPSERAGLPTARDVRAYRPSLPVTIFGLDRLDEQEFVDRLGARIDLMRAHGFLDEVSRLRPHLGRQASQAVGYKELIDVVDGRIDADTAFRRISVSTRALVKRQRTFLRRDPRIRWFDLTTSEQEAESTIMAAVTEGAQA
jgi:tRNA dimethylallyltransferase